MKNLLRSIQKDTSSLFSNMINLITTKHLTIFTIILLSSQISYSQTKTFVGGSPNGNDWFDPLNWANNMIGGNGDNVFLNADVSLSDSITVRLFDTNDNKLTIENTTLARLTARSISIDNDGEIENKGILEAKNLISGNAISVSGILKNFSQVMHESNIVVNGDGQLLNKKNTISTTTVDGKILVASSGTFINEGFIKGPYETIQLSGTSNLTNTNSGFIQVDTFSICLIRMIDNAEFTNEAEIYGNMEIRMDDSTTFENFGDIDIFNNEVFATEALEIKEDASFTNHLGGDVRMAKPGMQGPVVTQNKNTMFQNFGKFEIVGGQFLSSVHSSNTGAFLNGSTGELLIKNTSDAGIRFLSSNSGQIVNDGILGLCNTNVTTGTCPIIASSSTILENTGQIYTGVDIYNGNCSTIVQNAIVNLGGTVSPGCAPTNSNCPSDYAGTNKITGIVDGPADYETDGIIESDAAVSSGTVFFDSGISVTLLPNFEVLLNTTFTAFIDGCQGM